MRLACIPCLLAILPTTPLLAYQDSSAFWAQLWTGDSKYIVNSIPYDIASAPNAQTYIWMNNQNDWGGNIAFNGGGGGIGVQIFAGQWPWSSSRTANSGLPSQISAGRAVKSFWNFQLYQFDQWATKWTTYWEIWIHQSNSINGNNITCDLMVLPDYNGDLGGAYSHEVTFDNVRYGVYYYAPVGSRYFPIVHYRRSSKTQSPATINLKNFWDDCTRRNWAKRADWVGSVNAGLEMFWASGRIKSTSFSVW